MFPRKLKGMTFLLNSKKEIRLYKVLYGNLDLKVIHNLQDFNPAF